MKRNILLLVSFILLILFLNNGMHVFAHSGEVLQSFKAPGNFPTGMTYDGENLWVADRQAKLIYCIDPENGKVIRSIPTPGILAYRIMLGWRLFVGCRYERWFASF